MCLMLAYAINVEVWKGWEQRSVEKGWTALSSEARGGKWGSSPMAKVSIVTKEGRIEVE